jgi:hypothetical protein
MEMRHLLGILAISAGALFFVFVFLLPSMITIYMTSKNFGLLLSAGYWTTVGGAWAPHLIGLILFLVIYPMTKAPGEGGIAGLWFIFLGFGSMTVQSIRYVLKTNKGETLEFWDVVKLSLWPYGILLVLMILVVLVGLFFTWRDKSGSN